MFLISFPLDFFGALVKRLSVRGTQKRDKKVLRGRASNLFPPYPFFFSAFLGVSRQGEFENTRKKLSTFQKKNTGEIFFGGRTFFWGIFQLFFLSIFLLRWLSASR